MSYEKQRILCIFLRTPSTLRPLNDMENDIGTQVYGGGDSKAVS